MKSAATRSIEGSATPHLHVETRGSGDEREEWAWRDGRISVSWHYSFTSCFIIIIIIVTIVIIINHRYVDGYTYLCVFVLTLPIVGQPPKQQQKRNDWHVKERE